LGSSLPPAELARQDSTVFVEMKCSFSIAPKESFQRSHVSISDARPASDVVWLSVLCVGTSDECASNAGRTLFERPVQFVHKRTFFC